MKSNFFGIKNCLSVVLKAFLMTLVLISLSALHDYHAQESENVRKKILNLQKQADSITRDICVKNDEIQRLNSAINNGNWFEKKCFKVQIEILNYKILKEHARKMSIVEQYTKLIKDISTPYYVFWQQVWHRRCISYFIFSLFTFSLFPILISLFMYYIFGSWVEKRKRIIINLSASEKNDNIKQKKTGARIEYSLPLDKHLFLRAGWFKSRENMTTKTRLLWKWSSPIISLVSGMYELIDFSCNNRSSKITITAPFEDLFITQIDLNGGEMVVRPRFLVGVTGDITIRTHWDFSPHSILSGRLRRVILCGEGSIFVTGSWGIDFQKASAGKDHRIESKMLLGYDTGAQYSLCRTETF